MLPFNEYQNQIAKFDRSPMTDWYYALGLTGEAGEVAEKIKKKYRDPEVELEDESVAYELGDILWYVARMARHYGYKLEEIAEMNIEKLRVREQKGTLTGQGE